MTFSCQTSYRCKKLVKQRAKLSVLASEVSKQMQVHSPNAPWGNHSTIKAIFKNGANIKSMPHTSNN